MHMKSLGIAMLLAGSLLPSSTFAAAKTPAEALAEKNLSTVPNGSIVILKQEQTETPGYFHTWYALIDHDCGALLVDRYGPAVDPNDRKLKRDEQRFCSDVGNTSDG